MKNSHFIPFNRIIIIFSLFIIGLNFAMAQTFLGTVNDLWSNPDNWLDGLKPNEESELVSINADVIVDENVTIQNLYDAIPCTLTIQSGKKLVVISTIVWDKGGLFILEDEAQLVNDDPIQILFKKTIEAYDEHNHPWDIIASPIAESFMPTTENGFLTEPETGYALLTYDEASHSFLNFKEESFPITNGKGYLYANALDTTLLFSGFTHGSGTPIEVNLDYHSSNNNLAGYNFVGNPLPCNAYSSKSYYVLDPITYRLTPVMASSATAIKPCSGIFVKADAINEAVAFSRNEDYSQHQGHIAIYLTQTDAHDPLDQAIISFNPNDNLGKFTLNAEAPKVYFTDNNQNLAIISIDSLDALPLRFKAYENGNYTLRFEVNEMEISTLNLIDNIAGSQTDLLSNPNYTFSANTNDYASRFKIVFKPDYGIEELENEVFAYYSNGAIRLYGLDSSKELSLQICDLAGRTVWSETINNRDGEHTVSMKLIPGIYLLRLTDGSRIQTQKIVIK